VARNPAEGSAPRTDAADAPTAPGDSAGGQGPTPPPDPGAILRSRGFKALLVFAAVIGVVVSFLSWAFLELVHLIQVGVFDKLPDALGFDSVPSWWSIPWLVLAGLVVAFAVVKLPGNGGHIPAEGLAMGSSEPNIVPGVALAALATLGLGAVLGPEAPLITMGAGIAVFVVRRVRRNAPLQLQQVLGAAGSFAAISVIFGSPITAAVLVIEASGLGGATLPLILIPGLMAAGIGSLVFIGMAHATGLSTAAYALVPLQLPAFAHPTWSEIGWTIAFGIAGALVVYVVRRFGVRVARLVPRRPFVLIPAAGLIIALVALVFGQIEPSKGAEAILFSGQDSLPGLVAGAGTWTVAALFLLLLCKSVAWSVSLGSFRGGPTFPAIFVGAAGGILASHLPGFPLTPAVAVGMGVAVASFLKLPLSAIVIAAVLTTSGGAASVPLIIVGVVVAYLTTLGIEGRLGPPHDPKPRGTTAQLGG
jgi:chloride channel protein, CIC family